MSVCPAAQSDDACNEPMQIEPMVFFLLITKRKLTNGAPSQLNERLQSGQTLCFIESRNERGKVANNSSRLRPVPSGC